MAKMLFCSKCGAADQSAESYCKRCGDWVPDVDALTRRGLFRKRTREEKLRKMRVLEMVSAGLSLTSAAIIAAVLVGNDRQFLFLAFLCCLFVALYQGVNFYLGRNLQQKINESRVKERGTLPESRVGALNSGEATEFVNNVSVVENTTKRLEPIPRKPNRPD